MALETKTFPAPLTWDSLGEHVADLDATDNDRYGDYWIPESLRAVWPQLPLECKTAAYIVAQDVADTMRRNSYDNYDGF